MEKKYVGILFSNSAIAKCYVYIKSFKSMKEKIDNWKLDIDFSEENMNICTSWKGRETGNIWDFCVIDNWDDEKKVSKLRKLLLEWCNVIPKVWKKRDWNPLNCFDFRIFNDADVIYNACYDYDLVHGEYDFFAEREAKCKYDLFVDDPKKSEKYLYNVIDDLVKRDGKPKPVYEDEE